MDIKTGLFCCCLCCLFCEPAFCGESIDTISIPVRENTDSIPATSVFENLETPKQDAVDVVDLLKRITKTATKTRNEVGVVHISAIPAVGYSLQTGFAAVVSANVAFKSKDPELRSDKTSYMYSSFAYTQYKQIILPFRASIWAAKGKYNLQLDWRFMKYPSETFGLGAYTNFSDGYAISFNYLKLHQTVVTKVGQNLYAGLGYYLDRFWKIQETGVPQKTPTDYQQYGLYETATASGFALQLFHDSRKNPINPNNGWYGNFVLRPNLAILGAGSNWTSVQLEFRKYFRFPGKSENVLAFWNYNWFLAGGGKAPYLLLPSTGWDDNFNTGRGYIQGRFRGTSMVYLEGEYRFKISRKGFLGGVVFANAQSFAQSPDRQFKVISPAFGGGLRIKLNKFSGANLCIDYGIGLQGSRGISVNIGEIF